MSKNNTPIPPGPYRVGQLLIQVRLDYLDQEGTVKSELWCNPIPVYPADLTPALREFLTAKGLSESP